MKHRREKDSMGEVEVPAERYWGAQTQRAVQNFRIGRERMPLAIIHAYAIVKKAAAVVNEGLDLLDADKARAITSAAQEILDGKLDAEFPLPVWQSGSGTQTNMNVNEVIANRASELLGGGRGARRRMHPNDDVNRSQSTNDTFPTAMHIAAARGVVGALLPALAGLAQTLEAKAAAHGDVVKTGRTHLMDATPVSLGQVFAGWAQQVADASRAVDTALAPVYELAIGGTAVGTGLNTYPRYATDVVAEIAAETGLPFVPAPNKLAGMAGHDALVGLSGALRQTACALTKIANDIRWLASGPRCGIGELRIPANEPGSSIMPGKVNPTQCEMLTMVCAQVMGNDTALAIGGSQGQFELNVYKPLIARNLLESITLLSDAVTSFRDNCVEGIEPDRERIARLLEQSLMLVTALAPRIGYEEAAAVARRAYAEGTSLREAAVTLGVITEEQFDRYVVPSEMIAPNLGKATEGPEAQG